MTEYTTNQLLFSFSLTIFAGIATMLGGMAIFFKSLVHMANPKSLALSLSLAGGVMLFISLVEIFNESREKFEEAFESEGKETKEGHAFLFSTLSFILGGIMVYLMDYFVHKFAPEAHQDLKLSDLEELRKSFDPENKSDSNGVIVTPNSEAVLIEVSSETKDKTSIEEKNHKLALTGLLTAVAMGLHNIPEGLITFVSAAESTSFGIALCIGITLHNIPEGLAVAAPVYFSSGSRLKALLWTGVSAIAQPIGGIIAWIIMGNEPSAWIIGVLYGFVTGMMVFISIKELIPTAREYYPEGDLVDGGVFGGMLVMALSLILLKYAGL